MLTKKKKVLETRICETEERNFLPGLYKLYQDFTGTLPGLNRQSHCVTCRLKGYSFSLILNHLAPKLYSRNALDHQLSEKPKREVLHPNNETVAGPFSIVSIASIVILLSLDLQLPGNSVRYQMMSRHLSPLPGMLAIMLPPSIALNRQFMVFLQEDKSVLDFLLRHVFIKLETI